MHTHNHRHPQAPPPKIKQTTTLTHKACTSHTTQTLTCWLMDIPAFTQKNTHTVTFVYKRSYPHVCTHSHSCIKTAVTRHTHTCALKHTCAGNHTHAVAPHTQSDSCIERHSQTQNEPTPYTICRGSQTQSHLGTHVLMHTIMHTYSQTHAHMYVCVHTYTCAQTLQRTCIHI